MNSRACSAFLLALLLSMPSIFAYSASPSPLQVSAVQSSKNGKPLLLFTVTNTSKIPLVIRESRLPWGSRYSTLLTVVRRNDGIQLKGAFPIDDVFSDIEKSLPPNASLQGEIELGEYAINIKKELARTDLIVFWYYVANSVDGSLLGEYGGWAVLKKDKAVSRNRRAD
jgi:hypothetical protein